MSLPAKVIGRGVAGLVAIIIGSVFYLEGGYVNDPDDPGGETNYGITVEVARQHGYTGDMQELTREFATSIYYKSYIEAPGYLLVLEESPAVAHKLIDASVNIGPTYPSRWFQNSINSLSRDGKDYPKISVDGKVGPNTIIGYRGLVNRRGSIKACELTLKLIDAQQAVYYLNLTNLSMYTPGWVDHRIGNVPIEWCTNYMGRNHVDEINK